MTSQQIQVIEQMAKNILKIRDECGEAMMAEIENAKARLSSAEFRETSSREVMMGTCTSSQEVMMGICQSS